MPALATASFSCLHNFVHGQSCTLSTYKRNRPLPLLQTAQPSIEILLWLRRHACHILCNHTQLQTDKTDGHQQRDRAQAGIDVAACTASIVGLPTCRCKWHALDNIQVNQATLSKACMDVKEQPSLTRAKLDLAKAS